MLINLCTYFKEMSIFIFNDLIHLIKFKTFVNVVILEFCTNYIIFIIVNIFVFDNLIRLLKNSIFNFLFKLNVLCIFIVNKLTHPIMIYCFIHIFLIIFCFHYALFGFLSIFLFNDQIHLEEISSLIHHNVT